MGQVHGIIKIILCRLVLLLLPSSIIILTISLLILLLTIHHLNLTLRCYTFLIESYDLISKSLIILTIIAQKNVEYKKTLGLNIIILLIRLIITFRTVRIIIFFFTLFLHHYLCLFQS